MPGAAIATVRAAFGDGTTQAKTAFLVIRGDLFMAHEPDRAEHSDQRRSKPPLFVKMADEGNIPGRPSSKALVFIIVVMLAGLAMVYLAHRVG